MKKFLVVLLTAVIAAGALVVPAAAFKDVSDAHWATNYIAYAEAYGLVNGVGDGKFAPDSALTEAQCCQVVYNTIMYATDSKVKESSPWYKTAVDYVEKQAKISISPDRTATRAFICVLAYSFQKEAPRASTTSTQLFPDCVNLDSSTKTAIQFCQSKGFINGYPDGNFHPNDTLTRAQGAKIFALWHNRYFDSIGVDPAKKMTVKQESVVRGEAMGMYARGLGWKTEVGEWPSYKKNEGVYWHRVKATNKTGTFEFLVGGDTDGAETWWYLVDSDGFELLTSDSVKASLAKWAR